MKCNLVKVKCQFVFKGLRITNRLWQFCHMSHISVTCQTVLSHVTHFCHMSHISVTCHTVLSHVTHFCHIVLSHVTQFYHMSHSSVTCHIVLSHVTQFCHMSHISVLFQIVAREIDTVERRSSTADVTIKIIDMNDNYPVFTPANVGPLTIAEDATLGTQLVILHVRNTSSCEALTKIHFKN